MTKKKFYHIYLIRNKKTGQTYVGKTAQRIGLRENQHLKSIDHSPIDNAIREEGADNFEVTTYCECKTQEELDEAEQEVMSKLRMQGVELYNVYYGRGHYGIKVSKGRVSYYYPNLSCCSEFYGYTSNAIRDACNGHYKLGGYLFSWSDEKGHAIENFVKKYIKPVAKKTRICSKVRCIETGRIYRNIKEAAKAVGVGSRSLNKVLVGLHKTSAGYHWERIK